MAALACSTLTMMSRAGGFDLGVILPEGRILAEFGGQPGVERLYVLVSCVGGDEAGDETAGFLGVLLAAEDLVGEPVGQSAWRFWASSSARRSASMGSEWSASGWFMDLCSFVHAFCTVRRPQADVGDGGCYNCRLTAIP
ncbi:hypothetical protein [Thiocystis violascens]|uniref:hypothetical protein n=1 Tax=Thiocystis violascens TaxID=73141 RepID=UPI0002FE50B1|nr:hypothetical protein [Thiocystis violascens]